MIFIRHILCSISPNYDETNSLRTRYLIVDYNEIWLLMLQWWFMKFIHPQFVLNGKTKLLMIEYKLMRKLIDNCVNVQRFVCGIGSGSDSLKIRRIIHNIFLSDGTLAIWSIGVRYTYHAITCMWWIKMDKWTAAIIDVINNNYTTLKIHYIFSPIYNSANTDNAHYLVIISGTFGLSLLDTIACSNYYGDAVPVGGTFQTVDFLSSYVFLECLQMDSLLCFWSDCNTFLCLM